MCDSKQTADLSRMMDELRKPFHPSQITWKPGAVKGDRALAMAYADVRAYMNRLDEVCGPSWAVAYEPWGDDRLICRLTILGVTRSSTGETTNESERSEIGGTVAEAQAFKRASAMFGLGRYLYTLPTGWADYDPGKKQFTDKAKAKLTGILVQHYRRVVGKAPGAPTEADEIGPVDAPASPALERLDSQGRAVFGTDWEMATGWLVSKWTAKMTPQNTRNNAAELSDDERDMLADYMAAQAYNLQKVWPNQRAIMLQTAGEVAS
jgi:hypothetical protein